MGQKDGVDNGWIGRRQTGCVHRQMGVMVGGQSIGIQWASGVTVKQANGWNDGLQKRSRQAGRLGFLEENRAMMTGQVDGYWTSTVNIQGLKCYTVENILQTHLTFAKCFRLSADFCFRCNSFSFRSFLMLCTLWNIHIHTVCTHIYKNLMSIHTRQLVSFSKNNSWSRLTRHLLVVWTLPGLQDMTENNIFMHHHNSESYFDIVPYFR